MRATIKSGLISVFLFILSFPHFVQAQIIEPVKWEFKTKITGTNTAELQFVASIGKGWHLYSQHLPDGGPMPTEFKFEKLNGVQLIGASTEPAAHEVFDEMFQMKVKYFDNSVTFVQKIKLSGDKPVLVSGVLNYQACNDETCVPGESEFSFNVPGSTAQAEAPVSNTNTISGPNVDTLTTVQEEPVAIQAPAPPTKTEIKAIATNDEFSKKKRKRSFALVVLCSGVCLGVCWLSSHLVYSR